VGDISVLIIEEDPVLAIDLARILTENSYHVAGILSAEETVFDVLGSRQIDLVLIDVDAQGGLDSLELIRRIRKNYDLPILVLTSFEDLDKLDRLKKADTQDYISRDKYRKELRAIVEITLNRHTISKITREKEEILSTTLANINEAMVTTREDGTVLFYNRKAQEIFFFRPFDKAVPAEEKITAVRFFRDDETQLENIFQCDEIPRRLYLSPADGPKPDFRMNLTPAASGYTPLECSLIKARSPHSESFQKIFVFRDISADILAMDLFAFLRSIILTSDDLVVGMDLLGRIRAWNQGAYRFTGLTQEQVHGQALGEIFPEIPLPKFSYSNRLLENREFFFHCSRQRRAFLNAHLCPLFDEEKNLAGYSFIARDITERTVVEKQVLEAEERERMRLGRDIHDGLGQELTGIHFKVQALQSAIGKQNFSAAKNLAREVQDLVVKSVSTIRDLSRGLTPLILLNEGLNESLNSLVEHTGSTCPVKVSFQGDPITGLTVDEQRQFFYIAREAINNAVKHSGAAAIEVRLKSTPQGCELTIKDDGRGFDPGKIKRGLGMNTMQYRSDIINGELEIRSRRGEGTVIRCILEAARRAEADSADGIASLE
jgi:PAS domain S-box-containing protein